MKKHSHFHLIFTFLRGCKRYFLFGIACAIGVTLTDLLNPQIVRFTVDAVLGDQEPSLPDAAMSLVDAVGGVSYLREHLGLIAIAIVAVSVLSLLLQYGFQLFNSMGAERLVRSIRDRVFCHIERLPFAWHMKQQTGDIIQRCTSDVDMIKRFVADQLTSLFKTGLMLVMSLIFMCSMNLKLSIIAMVSIPVILTYSSLFHRRIGRGFTACDESEGKLSAIAQENLTGVRVVRAFGREGYERARFGAQNEEYTSLWRHLNRVFSTFWATADLISGIQVLLIVTLGAYFCIRGEMTSGDYIAFISYNAMLTWPVRHLGRMISEMSKAGVSLKRIAEILSAEPETDRAGASEPDLRGDIVFDHVSFGYAGCPELIHDVSFTVPAGGTLGILGGTGSGKSTLAYLLCRLYDLAPDGGSITIGGVNIADIRAAHLRRGIGMVMQEPFLFARTLGENIGIALETDADSDACIREAAETACLSETIEGFTEGYDTLVGERGVTLSGGQKQRAAIARALVRPTPILVFDDALSAVDTETDAKIRAALAARTGGATRIYISHRVTTLMHCDRILVLENGRVSQYGTHDELVAQSGLYRDIYRIQTNREDESGEVSA
ncbi:MAG: ABC transporter ATP-binding protein [Clostridia bacterium]|nr:ABC transporter ATP-binding protein [Clostridia bacterium]